MDADRKGEVRKHLVRAPLFENLGDGDLDDLLELARLQSAKAREEVFHKGDEGRQVFVIVQGRLKAVTTSSEGDDVAFSIMGPGEIFGELSLLSASPRSATVTAIEAAKMVVLDRREFLPFLERHPRVAIELLEVMAARLRRISEFVEDTTFLKLPSRLAKKLLGLARAYGVETPEGIRIDLKLSQEELGDLVATTRESINKQMKLWAKEGVASMDRKEITLLRPEALEVLAGFSAD